MQFLEFTCNDKKGILLCVEELSIMDEITK